MKAFVIKNKEGQYYTTHLNYEDIHTKDISEANIFNEETANDIKLFLDKTTCRYGEKWDVVEITIAEGDLEQQLAIYKRALKLACRRIDELTGNEDSEYVTDTFTFELLAKEEQEKEKQDANK